MSKVLRSIIRYIPWVFAYALSWLPAVFMGSVYGWIPGIFFTLAAIVDFFYLLLLKKGLSLRADFGSENCVRGEELDFGIGLTNKLLLLYPRIEAVLFISDLFGDDDSLTSSVVSLGAKEGRDFAFGARFDHIGSFTAGLRHLRIGDLIGLFHADKKHDFAYNVDVAPRIVGIDRRRILENSVVESEHMMVQAIVDGAEYTGVREYVPGDPIKTIHWKLSARSNTYLTKQFVSYGTEGIAVILDFYSPAYDREVMMDVFDTVVESGLSICAFADSNGMDNTLVYMDTSDEIAKVQGAVRGDLADLVRTMPRISSKGADIAPSLLRKEGHERYSAAYIVYISSKISEEAVNEITALRSRGKRVSVIAVTPRSVDGRDREDLLAPLKSLAGLGVGCSVINSADELSAPEKKR